MTVAVIVDTGRDSPLPSLCDRLAKLNVPDVHVVARPNADPPVPEGPPVHASPDVAGDLREIARLARAADEAGQAVAVLPADLVVGEGLLLALLGGTRSVVAALTVEPDPEHSFGTAPVRVEGGAIRSAGSRHHRVTSPNAASVGALRAGPARAGTVAEVAERLASLVEDAGVGRDPGEASELLLVGLVRCGVPVAPCHDERLVCRRTSGERDVREAREADERVDEDRVRLAAAVKSDDGFFATFAVSSFSPYLVRWAARRGLTPNTVTVMSMALAALAAMWFAAGTRPGMVAGAVLLYLAFVLDCVDGQLARYTRAFSDFGGWLDGMLDRAKEYTVYAGLAVGSTAAAAGDAVHAGDVWGLAIAAMILQTVRHSIAFSSGAAAQAAVRPVTVREPLLEAPDDGTSAAVPPPDGNRLLRASRGANRVPGVGWLRRIVVLPIGERFALIAVTAALFDARVTFLALLVWGGLAAVYTLAGKVLRSPRPRPEGRVA